MDRVLHRRRFFERVVPRSMYEAEFEGRILAQKDQLFPDWHVCEFRASVDAAGIGYGPKQPDFALIHREYVTWWVVEVEMTHHSIAHHVEPQVAVFTHGRYRDEHANYIAQRAPTLDGERLRRLVTQVQPSVLVVLNDDVPEAWPSILSPYECRFCVLKAYQNDLGEAAYLLDGALPNADGGTLCHCRRVEAMGRALALDNPAALALPSGGVVHVRTEEGIATFQFALLGDQAFLFAIGGWPFPARAKEFRLARSSDGELSLTPWAGKADRRTR